MGYPLSIAMIIQGLPFIHSKNYTQGYPLSIVKIIQGYPLSIVKIIQGYPLSIVKIIQGYPLSIGKERDDTHLFVK